jgi:hypothetical protein
MKVVVGIVFGVLAVLGLSLAAGRNAPDRPPGIAADRWAPVSDTLGFVLVPDSDLKATPPLPVGAGLTDLYAQPTAAVQAIIEEGYPVRGYIMVKRGRIWRPLTVVAPTVNN